MTAAIEALVRDEGGKILLFVIDGVGGLPHPARGKSELEAARIPNLNALAARSSVGRLAILPPGMTPGSGPGHLSLFGYDPLGVTLGRGVLEALGSDYPLRAGEVAARGNFCTVDEDGVVTDRRAGRPSDEETKALCARLEREIRLEGCEIRLLPGKQHRFTLILRAAASGEALGARVSDNDPQVEGKKPLVVRGEDRASERTAALVARLLDAARERLAREPRASGMLLRGFSTHPEIAGFRERWGLRAAGIAIYPMYRGVARLCGMEILDAGNNLADQIAAAGKHFADFDLVFIHTKDADQAGHAGDFDAKVKVLEEVDRHIPRLLALGADVVIVTGDHSTPTLHREHSWHPVPVILSSPRVLPVPGTSFSERGVLGGELGTVPGHQLLPLALAHAGRLDKFGA